jgi:antitoxin PrlF
MPAALARVSKITSKGQTTVPKVVRDALGIEKGGTIAYHIDANGEVRLTSHAPDKDESAIDAFLTFLSDDIKRRPEAVTPLSRATVEELQALAAEIDVDLGDDFEGATAL